MQLALKILRATFLYPNFKNRFIHGFFSKLNIIFVIFIAFILLGQIYLHFTVVLQYEKLSILHGVMLTFFASKLLGLALSLNKPLNTKYLHYTLPLMIISFQLPIQFSSSQTLNFGEIESYLSKSS